MANKILTSTILVSLFVIANSFSNAERNGRLEQDERRRMHPDMNRHQINRNIEYEDKEHWFKTAQDTLASKLKINRVEKQAKNVIFFLGDGMSVPTVAAARILKGQQVDNLAFGEEGELHFETFPNVGVSKTFCSDAQVADSACSATAYLGGTKANMKTIGVTPAVQRFDCIAQMKPENQVPSILQWSQAAGKSTGIITTSRLTDASPAGTFSHIAERDWEDDATVRRDGHDSDTCDDITEQLIFNEPGKKFNVILGGGRNRFFNDTVADPEEGMGIRTDGKDLILEWKNSHLEKSAYVTNIEELSSVDTANTDYLLGLFAASEMAYYHDQPKESDPSLEEMTRVAIEILSRNPNGYFLFVEGGRIDHAHHSNWGQKALWETIEFDKAIKLADGITSIEDTTILVTADHAHVMTFSGYPDRGHPIVTSTDMADDDLPYTALAYANGPGYRELQPGNCTRYDISEDKLDDIEYQQVATAYRESEAHGGDDVLIYSRGPFSHLLTGVVMQNYIPHVLGYASCVGSGVTFCDENPGVETTTTPTTASPTTTTPQTTTASANYLFYQFNAMFIILASLILVVPYLQ